MTKRAVVVALLIAALSGCAQAEAPVRPTLLLITGLPIVTGETFALDATGSPALTRLEQDFRVRPIGVSDSASLQGSDLLLMAQPRAQPAEALVDLDQWVRDGGRVMILADPRLEWPSKRPLGDALRPPFEYADTGLLKHWGLTMSAPEPGREATRKLGDADSIAASPGTVRADPASPCLVAPDGLVADCSIGRGRATVIADADLLNVDSPAALDSFVALLQQLRKKR